MITITQTLSKCKCKFCDELLDEEKRAFEIVCTLYNFSVNIKMINIQIYASI